jgi:hypothetical protein
MPFCPPLFLTASTLSVGVRSFKNRGVVCEKGTCTAYLFAATRTAGNMPLDFSSQDRLGTRNKESGPKGPGIELPPEGASIPFPLAAVGWSDGTLKNSKF